MSPGKPAADISWYLEGNNLTPQSQVTSQRRAGGPLYDVISVLRFNATLADAAKQIQCQAGVKKMTSPLNTFATLDVQCKYYSACIIDIRFGLAPTIEAKHNERMTGLK